MPIIHLEDLDDPRLAAYSGMTDAQLRDCPDSTHGLFIGCLLYTSPSPRD